MLRFNPSFNNNNNSNNNESNNNDNNTNNNNKSMNVESCIIFGSPSDVQTMYCQCFDRFWI